MSPILIRMIVSAALFAAGIFVKTELWYAEAGIFFAAYAVIGYDVVFKAVKNLFKGHVLDENLLMTVASAGAFVIRSYSEAVAVMLLYQVGEYFNNKAVEKSRRSIAALTKIRPDKANVIRGGELYEVLPEEVEVGESIAVKPGERIPLDGVVETGESALDTSALTGESVPRRVREGDKVLSGSINMSGLLNIRTTSGHCGSTVSRILELTENALDRKAKSEKFISRFAAVYTPIVVGLAVIAAVLPPLILKQPFSDWIYRALSFLVVSCPCALVISVPLTFFAAIGFASKRGILLKGSHAIEALDRAAIAAFDKTGTLTKGSFEVCKVECEGIGREELLYFAASAESFSSHPIAVSLRKAAPDFKNASEAEELAGLGVTAVVDGRTVIAGNRELMEKHEIPIRAESGEVSAVYIAIDGRYAGRIDVADEVKPDAADAAARLKKLGVRKTVMLTGDCESAAAKIMAKIGIDKALSELLPEQKAEAMEALLAEKKKGESVIFAGDGINDAPVLALADAGIAMGGMGSDAAIEAADVVIMTDEPAKIAEAVKISRRTMRIVYENIIFSLVIKAAAIVLAALGIAGMWLAVFADVGVAMIAVLNALRAGSRIK